MIPKILHYCWFGGGEMPEEHQRFIDGWRNILHDYQVMRWDETNSPMYLLYMQTALKNKKWANLSNYTRLHAIYEHGGIYLDTDIEVLKSFNALLDNPCFLGFENNKIDWSGCINNAVLGAVPQHPFIYELKETLLGRFDGSEKANLSSPELTTSVLKSKGLKVYKEQTIDTVHIYPLEYFYPYAWYETFNPACIKEITFCIHHWQKSWALEQSSVSQYKGYKSYIKQVATRLKHLLSVK